jgi:hypothetical protein
MGLAQSFRDDDRQWLANQIPPAPTQQLLCCGVDVDDAAALVGHDDGIGKSVEDLLNAYSGELRRAIPRSGVLCNPRVIRHSRDLPNLLGAFVGFEPLINRV